jgi:GNAT superfamily N-acetyltransferase
VEDMQIKELEEVEIKKVVDFYKTVVHYPGDVEYDEGDFEEEIKSAFGNDHMLIAIESNEIVGFLRSQVLKKKDAKKIDKVIMLLVSPEKYGEGIGGELIEKEREWARDTGVNVLDIEVK